MDVDQKWKELYGNKCEESSDDDSPSSPMEFREWQRHVPPVRIDANLNYEDDEVYDK